MLQMHLNAGFGVHKRLAAPYICLSKPTKG